MHVFSGYAWPVSCVRGEERVGHCGCWLTGYAPVKVRRAKIETSVAQAIAVALVADIVLCAVETRGEEDEVWVEGSQGEDEALGDGLQRG